MGMTVTNNDIGELILDNAKYQNAVLSVAGAGTIKAGTILARKLVSDTVTAAAKEGGNTGNGTCTALSLNTGRIPRAGAYRLICSAAVTNGGTFKLIDPDGNVVATNLSITAGAGQATVIEADGLVFTITDGTTDFAAGDEFVITVTAGVKLVVFAANGTGGAQIPVAVLTYEVVASGAGDIPVRVLIGGDVRKDKLVIAADGNSTNVSAVVRDQLRDYGINVFDTKQLSVLDNQ